MAVSRQAITAAGHGALVGRTVVADARRDRGYWDDVAERVDWIRREAELGGERKTRDRWREWIEDRRPDDLALDDTTFEELREAEIDRRLAAYRSDAELERRRRRAHDRLLEHVDTERIRAYLARVDGTEDAGEADADGETAGSETSATDRS